jgi:hypothetical protein
MGQREEMVLTYLLTRFDSKVIEYVWCVSHSRASAIRIHKQSKLKKTKRGREKEKDKHLTLKIITSSSCILEKKNFLFMTLPTASEKSRIPEGNLFDLISLKFSLFRTFSFLYIFQ